MKTSFRSKYTLMKAVDQLPRGTEWKLKRITVEGNVVSNGGQRESEELELWLRDPVDCIRELMGNPEFEDVVAYAPERVFADDEGKTRRFDETWTGDWWWEMQVSLCVYYGAKQTYLIVVEGQVAGRGCCSTGDPRLRQNCAVAVPWGSGSVTSILDTGKYLQRHPPSAIKTRSYPNRLLTYHQTGVLLARHPVS
jgi:hypothetical protein